MTCTNGMTVFVSCPKSSNVYAERDWLLKMISTAGFKSGEVRSNNWKLKQKGDAYEVRLEWKQPETSLVLHMKARAAKTQKLTERIITLGCVAELLQIEQIEEQKESPAFSCDEGDRNTLNRNQGAHVVDDNILGKLQPNPIPESLIEAPRLQLFGDVLRGFIEKRGLSLSDVAEQLYTEAEFLSSILDGELPGALIDGDLLDDLAEVLEVSPNFFRILLRRTLKIEKVNHPDNDLPEQWLSEIWGDTLSTDTTEQESE